MAGRRRAWEPGALVALVAALTAGGSLATLAASRLTPLTPLDGPLLWWGVLIAVSFGIADRLEIHVETRRNSLSLSLSDLVLVLALFTLPAPVVLASRVGGGLAALVVDRVVRSWSKTAFNLALFVTEAGVASLLTALLAGGARVDDVGAWLAVLAALGANSVVGVVSIWAAITSTGDVEDRPSLTRALPLAATGSVAVGTLGLLAVVLGSERPAALALVAPTAILLFLSSRSYLHLAERQEVLARLQSYSSRVAASTSMGTSVEAVLRDAAEITRAEATELVLVDDDGNLEQWLRSGHDGGVFRTAPGGDDPGTDPAVALVLSGAADAVTTHDTVAVPLTVGDKRIGVITVRSRQGDTGTFEAVDSTVLGAIANHAAVAIENARLIDRLRDEAAERERLAHHDALTGLRNRRGFVAALRAALEHHHRTGRTFALAIMDLARFKDVNDTFGHGAGDHVLAVVTERLLELTRAGDVVARLGGDEFALLLDCGDPAMALEFGHRLIRRLEAPIVHDGVPVTISGRIGIACAPAHGADERALLHHADVALYSAKENGQPVVVFDDEKERATTRRHRLALDLRRALEGGDELALHYQPKANLAAGRVSSVEALLRWHHPSLGPVPPDEFVRIAEQSGLINRLTGFVLEQGIRQAGDWQRSGLSLGMSLNVSVANLADESLPDRVSELLRRNDVEAGRITLEVTETEIMRDPSRTTQILAALDAIGVRLSIDDFGTGYSSLAYLKRIPVRELKIDKCFVTDLEHDASDLVIARSVIGLATNLSLTCVAEGVESRATWGILDELGCTEAQGYYLARPMSARETEQFVTSRPGRTCGPLD